MTGPSQGPKFGTDGVRGVANSELTPEFVLALGRAAAQVLGGPRFLIGRDTRVSGPLLQAALTAGIAGEGVDVVDLGVIPTPGVAALAAAEGVPAAMISASHNPFPDNGIKLFAAGGRKLADEVEAQLEARLEELWGGKGGAPRAAGSVVPAGGVGGRPGPSVPTAAETPVVAVPGRPVLGRPVGAAGASMAGHAVRPVVDQSAGAAVDQPAGAAVDQPAGAAVDQPAGATEGRATEGRATEAGGATAGGAAAGGAAAGGAAVAAAAVAGGAAVGQAVAGQAVAGRADVGQAVAGRADVGQAAGAVAGRAVGAAVGRAVADTGGRQRYQALVLASLAGRRLDGLRVALDCAHGAASVTAPELLRLAGADVVAVLADQPDGININDGCGSTHPGALQAVVLETGADVGLALDGDADRVIAVDHTGSVVDGDQMIAALALDRRGRGALAGGTVVVTVMTNLGFHLAMAEHGVAVHTTPVGDRHVLEALERGGWSLGGEQSGHVIFPDLATTGDGTLTGLQLLDAVVRAGLPLAELAGQAMMRLPQILRNVPVAHPGSLAAATEIWSEVEAVKAGFGKWGRVVVRGSGTEPLVRVMVEAPTHDEAEQAAARLADVVARVIG